MVEGEYSLNILALQLLRFGIDSVLTIVKESINQWINYKGVYRTAPAKQVLLKCLNVFLFYKKKTDEEWLNYIK